MGEGACAVIEEALRSLDIETRSGVTITAVTERGARLVVRRGDRRRHGRLVRRHAGASANRLSAGSARPLWTYRSRSLPKGRGIARMSSSPATCCRANRCSACSVMSCQHARPMGRIAGHNVVCDRGEADAPARYRRLREILDLGAWGAVYTEGWDRRVAVTGAAAKRTKRLINCERIYPPRSRDAAENSRRGGARQPGAAAAVLGRLGMRVYGLCSGG